MRGRGTASRVQGRFERLQREAFDDGWESPFSDPVQDDVIQAQVVTEVRKEQARSIISRNDSPDIGFNLSINPYRGCEHGCVYCYARPGHAWLGLSAGLDFETRLIAKENAASLLRQELAAPGYRCETMAVGVYTDAWQPVERDLGITRACLQVLHDCGHPVHLITKSSLIEREIDLLAPMARRGLVSVMVSVTTLDSRLSRRLEPRAAAPHRRLRTIETLAAAGIPVGVSVAPVIPFLNEPEIEAILDASHAAGARFANRVILRLPLELHALFREWLQLHVPDRAARVMARIADMRGGGHNDVRFGYRMRGEGAWADLVHQRFLMRSRRLGMALRSPGLSLMHFQPELLTDAPRQGSLF